MKNVEVIELLMEILVCPNIDSIFIETYDCMLYERIIEPE